MASAAIADWTWNITQALERARREERPVLLYSVESRLVCGPLERDAPSDKRFIELAPHFVLAKVRAAEAPREFGVWRGRSIVVIVDLNGRPAERLVQPQTLDPILSAMRRQVERARRQRAGRIAYVESFGPQTPERAREIERLIRALGSEDALERASASRRLVRHGEAAFARITTWQTDDAEIRARLRDLTRRLQDIRASIIGRGLQRDPGWLAVHAPGRLRRILPPGAFDEDPVDRFERVRGLFRWDPGGDRFVAWRPWHNAAIRLRDRDSVALVGTRGALDLARPFTIETWIRWSARNRPPMVCVAGDEAWRGMHKDVRADGTSGWVIRRHLQGTHAMLDFTLGVKPTGWFQLLGVPRDHGNDWAHVAVVRDASAIRLYYNGEEIARRACAGTTFRPSRSRVFLGVRERGWHDRVSDHDLRGFHVTQRVKYEAPFLPAQRLAKDASSLVHYEFAGVEGTLRDTSGNTRHAVAANWVRTIRGPGFTTFEAERGRWSSQWYLEDRAGCSDGRAVAVGTIREPADGHWVELPFRVAERGRYRLLFAGAGLQGLGRSISSFTWRVDGAAFQYARPDLVLPGGAEGLGVLGTLDLQPGLHHFTLRLTRPRRIPDERWSLWFDALVLQRR
jgi:hypothetical protein